MVGVIKKYFPEISATQEQQFSALYDLYGEWNERINVISRKDIEHLYVRHVLHSLAIAKVCRFDAGARVLDVGCGGGFPGIPLAIMFPEADLTMVDSIGKKIKVVEAVSGALSLGNVKAVNGRAESIQGKFDYVISRAVTDMKSFTGWVWNKIEYGIHGSLPNGILYLKGGDLSGELAQAGKKYTLYDIPDFFDEEFFETKKVVYIPREQ